MKNNILKLVFASAFALVAGYSVYTSQQKVEMSDLAKANIEALAGCEWNNWFGEPVYHPLAELSQCILDSSNGSIINVI